MTQRAKPPKIALGPKDESRGWEHDNSFVFSHDAWRFVPERRRVRNKRRRKRKKP